MVKKDVFVQLEPLLTKPSEVIFLARFHEEVKDGRIGEPPVALAVHKLTVYYKARLLFHPPGHAFGDTCYPSIVVVRSIINTKDVGDH